MKMNDPHNIVVTDIQPPIVVHAQKGWTFHMTDRESFGLSLCMRGQITYTMHEKTYVSHPGNAVILPQGGTYSLVGDKDGLFPVINFRCANFRCDEILVVPLDHPQRSISRFHSLQGLFRRNDSSFEIYSAFYELLQAVFATDTKRPLPLDRAVTYIEKNLQDQSLSNSTVAEQVGISEVYLRKLFTAHCGMAPKQYILEVRLRKAKELLTNSPFSVTAIAEECGFSSVYHFCRVFKRRVGMTPTQYAVNNKVLQI